MEKSRIFKCCDAYTSSQIIAWIQIFLNVQGVLFMILGLTVSANNWNQIKQKGELIDTKKYFDMRAVWTWMIVWMVIHILGLFLGIILLFGVCLKRRWFLFCWLLFAIVLCISSIVATIFWNGAICDKIGQSLLISILYILGFWAVLCYTIDIRNEQPIPLRISCRCRN